MVIVSRGYVSSPADAQLAEEEFRLFVRHLDLILSHEVEILGNKDLFFCPLAFACCSWPYVSGDGPLFLGYLLLGWKNGIFTEPCPNCNGKVLVLSFGGSPLSGCCSWSGICLSCREERKARGSVHKPFAKKVEFVCKLRSTYPEKVCQWEEHDGLEFSWGGAGLTPARKKQPVWISLANPRSLAALIELLNEGKAIEKSPVNVSNLRNDLRVKFDDG